MKELVGFRTVKGKNGKQRKIPIYMQSGDKFIQKAVKRPGRVREYLRRTYGDEAFDSRGRIKPEYLKKGKERAESEGNRSLVDAIDLATRLKKMH